MFVRELILDHCQTTMRHPLLFGSMQGAAAALEALMAAWEALQLRSAKPSVWLTLCENAYAARREQHTAREDASASEIRMSVIDGGRARDDKVCTGMSRVFEVMKRQLAWSGVVDFVSDEQVEALEAFVAACMLEPPRSVSGVMYEMFLFELLTVWTRLRGGEFGSLHAAWGDEVRRSSKGRPTVFLGGAVQEGDSSLDGDARQIWIAPLEVAIASLDEYLALRR